MKAVFLLSLEEELLSYRVSDQTQNGLQLCIMRIRPILEMSLGLIHEYNQALPRNDNCNIFIQTQLALVFFFFFGVKVVMDRVSFKN